MTSVSICSAASGWPMFIWARASAVLAASISSDSSNASVSVPACSSKAWDKSACPAACKAVAIWARALMRCVGASMPARSFPAWAGPGFRACSSSTKAAWKSVRASWSASSANSSFTSASASRRAASSVNASSCCNNASSNGAASLSAFTWLRAMPVSTRIFPAGSSTASTNAMTEASAGSGAAGLLGVSGSGLCSGLAAACEGLDADGAVASLDCLGLLNAIPAMIRTPRPRPMMNGF